MKNYSLKNNFLSVSVNSLGAELTSLRKINSNEELIWQADKNIWPRHAPVLFPIVGKLGNNNYSFENKMYSLPQHGFARDKEFILINQNDKQLQFELTSNKETLPVYPFHFSLIVGYELKQNELIISYKVFNPDNENLLFSIGAHPGFNCKRINGESLSDFELEFKNINELTVEKLSNGLLNGETYKIKLDNDKLKLKKELFENDALVLKNSQVSEISLSSGKSKTRITLECNNWPYFGIWTKPEREDFICLEPWLGIADNENANGDIQKKEGIIVLKPYQIFDAFYKIKID